MNEAVNEAAPSEISNRELWLLLTLWAAFAAWSLVGPLGGYTVWLMEAGPVLIALAVMIPTRRRFPLTPLLYRLIFLHALVLTLGAAYTYAEVPLGEWAKQAFGFERNHYDRLGHFMQGFVPALVAREILLRKTGLVRGKMLFFLVTCVCLAVAAFYELIEWWVAVGFAEKGQTGQDFLGTQGDVWDAQWDMFLCLLGALVSQLSLSWLHDRQLGSNSD